MSAPAPDAEALPECFICTESAPAPRKSACKCTDRYVHDACLVKMIETTQRARCPACAEPYGNVASRSRVVGMDPFGRGAIVLWATLAATVLVGCGINTWLVFCCSQRKLSMLEDYLVCFAAIMMTTLGMALVAFIGRECVIEGPRALVKSALLRKRRVRVGEVMLGELVTTDAVA